MQLVSLQTECMSMACTQAASMTDVVMAVLEVGRARASAVSIEKLLKFIRIRKQNRVAKFAAEIARWDPGDDKGFRLTQNDPKRIVFVTSSSREVVALQWLDNRHIPRVVLDMMPITTDDADNDAESPTTPEAPVVADAARAEEWCTLM